MSLSMLYLDSSALVKLYVADPESTRVRQLVQEAPVCATSAIAYAEIRAAVARRLCGKARYRPLN